MQKIPVRQLTSATKNQDTIGRFSIREVQQLLNGKNLVHELHRHDFFFILAIHSGRGFHEIDFVPYNVEDNSVFILRPGQVHRLELTTASTGYLMEFHPSFYNPKNQGVAHRWKKATAKNYCAVEGAGFTKLERILNSILQEFTLREVDFKEAIISNLDLFFIEYVRQSQQPKFITKTNSDYTQDRFEELIHLLEIRIGSMKNVSEYAELLNLSPYQLNAITKSAVGKTVSALIIEQIVLEAKRHLLGTTNQIKDVADHLGYEDVSYFIRFFKKQTGYTPDAYRKNFK